MYVESALNWKRNDMLKPIKLTGEQTSVLFLQPKNPIQIKGVAGSGKTTVALYRAKHLLMQHPELFQEPFVIIFTYNKTLVKYLEALLPFVPGGYEEPKFFDKIRGREFRIDDKIEPGLKVNVTNFHKWAYSFLEQRGINLRSKILSRENKKTCISNSILNTKSLFSEANILNSNTSFFEEEFSWIKGKLLLSRDEYIETKRTGRGTQDRVTKDDKEVIYSAFEEYQTILSTGGLFDFDDFAILTLQELNKAPMEQPFTNIVVDEAQDLTKAQLIVISQIVSPETNSLTIIADSAQRIYKSGFTWSEVGINVRGGRTKELKKNYRTTKQVFDAALSLLENDLDKSDFTTHEDVDRNGSKPIICECANFYKQIDFITEQINRINLDEESIVILHRRRTGLNGIHKLLSNNGIEAEIIIDNGTIEYNNLPKICTLHSIKGLEFDHVFIIDLLESELPSQEGFTTQDDESHISAERRLLYTGMTRAKENLYLLYHGTPSIFIQNPNRDLFTYRIYP